MNKFTQPGFTIYTIAFIKCPYDRNIINFINVKTKGEIWIHKGRKSHENICAEKQT